MPEIVSTFVEVIVFRRSGGRISFLLLKRAMNERPYPGIWQIVSGKRRVREKAQTTALRELREETGLLPRRLWTLPLVNSFYDAGADRIHMVPSFAAEVDGSATVQLSAEHSRCRWVSSRMAAGLVQWPAHIHMMDLVKTHILDQRGSVHRIPLS